MFGVSVLRMTVSAEKAEEFEEQTRKQIAIVQEREPGTLLYAFCRRNASGSPALPVPAPNAKEYIHLMGYQDEAARDAHVTIERDWWGPTFRQYMIAPWVSERFDAASITTGVTRERSWSPGSLHRFAFHRFKIKEGMADEFEEQARKQISVVSEKEPGTVLYTFFRRSTDGSTLLPRSASGNAEYFHMMAYKDEESQAHHRELEHQTEGWAWGPIFRTFLEAPLESEGFTSTDIVTGVTRDAAWSPVSS